MPELKWNADLYNRQHHFVYKYGEDVLEWLEVQEGETILDVGCGTGQLNEQDPEAGAVVTGIDASAEMIEKARKNYEEIKFFVFDATNFSFEHSFDAVFSNATLHWINRQREALRCIYQAVKPGGRFVFEMGGKNNIHHIHRAVIESMTEEGVGNAIPAALNYFPSVAEQCGLLETIGFTVSEVRYFERPTRLEGEDGMELWIEQFCGFFRTVPPEVRNQVIAQAVRKLKKTSYKDGEWIADYVRLRVRAIKKK